MATTSTNKANTMNTRSEFSANQVMSQSKNKDLYSSYAQLLNERKVSDGVKAFPTKIDLNNHKTWGLV